MKIHSPQSRDPSILADRYYEIVTGTAFRDGFMNLRSAWGRQRVHNQSGSCRGSFTSFHSLLMIIVARSFDVYASIWACLPRGVAGAGEASRAAHFLRNAEAQDRCQLLGLMRHC